jgi:hypothetical protein
MATELLIYALLLHKNKEDISRIFFMVENKKRWLTHAGASCCQNQLEVFLFWRQQRNLNLKCSIE